MMSDRPILFLADNFYNPIQYPGHSIALGTPVVGHESFRVGTSRRSDQNYYQSTNTTGTLSATVILDRVRSADTLIVDRNHDAYGRQIRVWCKSNADIDQFIDLVLPAVGEGVVLGQSVDDPVHAIRTEEGAFIFHFPERAGLEWNVSISANIIPSPRLGGVYLGKSYRPNHPRMPFDGSGRWQEFGTVRRGVPHNDIRTGREATVSMLMTDEQEWDSARWQLRQLFGTGHPMWFIPEASRAERTWLGFNASGNVSAPFSERPQGRSVSINLEEYDPALP